jgi:hypothetical protein
MQCSDKTAAWLYRQCGSFLATVIVPNQFALSRAKRGDTEPSGLVRYRACAREATAVGGKIDVWEDGKRRRFVGVDDATVLNVPGVLGYLGRGTRGHGDPNQHQDRELEMVVEERVNHMQICNVPQEWSAPLLVAQILTISLPVLGLSPEF